jgi:stage V sporulation protein SpoVS
VAPNVASRRKDVDFQGSFAASLSSSDRLEVDKISVGALNADPL